MEFTNLRYLSDVQYESMLSLTSRWSTASLTLKLPVGIGVINCFTVGYGNIDRTEKAMANFGA